ncbi:terpenoid synthase [Apiospora rasikravindrae]|uniref:Terpenoid synthase n=1 Tax=Apiospora rasikravindrae TaxID=990691 RepID=A0ABR1S022_9PEZI
MNISQTLDYLIDSKPLHSVAKTLLGPESLTKTTLSILYRLKLALTRKAYTPIAANMEPTDEITRVYNDLKGKTLYLPDLRPVYTGWATGRNRHYERLLPIINDYIDKYIDDLKFRKKLKAIDLAAFTAVIYPDAEWDRLMTMGILCFFLFAFDDMIDKEIDPDVSDFASDIHSANQFRDDTALYIRKQLEAAQARRRSSLIPQTQATPHKLLQSFAHIAKACTSTSPAQLNRPLLAQDLEDFFLSNGPEQKFRLAGTLPTIKEYWDFRHGTGAVFIFADLAQYMADTQLPSELAWCEEVRVMRFEMSLQPILCNDLFSLKKEMAEGTASNLIPITIHEKADSLESAVDQVVDQMYASAERFEAAAGSLRARALRQQDSYDESTRDELDRFIATFESFQTGCFRFYMDSRRFGILQYRQEDGSFEIPL